MSTDESGAWRATPQLRRFIIPRIPGGHRARTLAPGRARRRCWPHGPGHLGHTPVAIASARTGKTTSLAVLPVLASTGRDVLHERRARAGGPDEESPCEAGNVWVVEPPGDRRNRYPGSSGGTRSMPAATSPGRVWRNPRQDHPDPGRNLSEGHAHSPRSLLGNGPRQSGPRNRSSAPCCSQPSTWCHFSPTLSQPDSEGSLGQLAGLPIGVVGPLEATATLHADHAGIVDHVSRG
jgi:hypothetical protein